VTTVNTITLTAAATVVAWTPSQDRTVIVPSMSSQLVRGIVSTTGSVLMLPNKQPTEDLDFNFDISSNLPFDDAIDRVTCSASNPAGLACVGAFGAGTLVTLWLVGGTAGQSYLFFVTVTTLQGRVRYLQAMILVPGIPQLPATITVVSVPQSYVDSAVAAVAATADAANATAIAAKIAAANALQVTGATMTGPLRPTITDGLVGTGTNQATALILTAQNVVISTATAAGGFRLPSASDVNGILAPITVRNKDTVNDATIYPPVGGQIDSVGINDPIAISTGGQITFLPGTTAGQWWA
jgi:hypothetical protein